MKNDFLGVRFPRGKGLLANKVIKVNDNWTFQGIAYKNRNFAEAARYRATLHMYNLNPNL